MISQEDSYTSSDPVYSDENLVAKCQTGESGAFGILMSRYESPLRSRIRRFGVNYNLAEDLEQEVWIRAFQKLDDLRNGSSFKAWLMQVADTTCIGHLRKDKRRNSVAPIVDVDVSTVEASADSIGDSVQDLATVTGLLVGLPPQYSEILMLKYLEQMSLQEIAEQIGLTLSGVKWRLNQAKQIFREAVEEMSGEQKDKSAIERLLHSAESATQLSRWQEAVETYEMVAKKAELDWESLSTLGRIYERRGDFHRAIKLLEKARQLNRWHWLSVVLGWCYDGLGDREKALSLYEEVLLCGNAGPWAAGAALSGLKSPHKRRKSEPEPTVKERQVPHRGWSVRTNHNPDEAHLAVDGDLTTRWTSQAAQDHNMYFELDLGKAWPITRIVIDDDSSGQCIWIADCPHGYAIDTSLDHANWKTVAMGSANADEYAGAVMEGSPVRYIKIRLTQDFYPNWWGIYEIRVYAR